MKVKAVGFSESGNVYQTTNCRVTCHKTGEPQIFMWNQFLRIIIQNDIINSALEKVEVVPKHTVKACGGVEW
jgi:hypothetical protein